MLHLHASVYLVSLLYSLCNNTPIRGVNNSSHHMQGCIISSTLAVILFAFNYLRNSAVSPRESFPICQKNDLKLSPIRCTIFPIGDSLGIKTKYVNIVFHFEMLFFDIMKALLRSGL